MLVVEDFAAVVLLAVLAGYANHDPGSAVEIWPIVIKMAVFAIGALVFGTLLAPRLMDLLDYLKSRETLLIGSLGACFGVGLLAREMGLSAGAGAFLIGTVLGDTRHRDQIARIITPVRDVFAALFFVSIGMLVNMAEIPEFFGSALIVTATLIVGKVMAATLGTLITGHDGETALKVGACKYINIKPGRIGGLTNAIRVHDMCRDAGVPVWVGGMLESALGGAICVEVATLPNFTYPGDLFPSSRFYTQDLSDPPLELNDRLMFEPLECMLPEPDPDRLARQTLRSATVKPDQV